MAKINKVTSPWLRYDNAIFDVDGTLFDSYPGVSACVRYAYEQMGDPVPDEDVLRTFLGPSLHDSFTKYTDWPEEKIDRAVAAYREKYAGGAYKQVDFFPGMRSLLTLLKLAGVKLTVASSKPMEVLEKVLDFKGVGTMFDCVSAPDYAHKSSDKAQLIERAAIGERPVMIGDRLYDVQGAKAAGVACIGAAFGYGGEEELKAYGADYIAHSADEIYSIITSGILKSIP